MSVRTLLVLGRVSNLPTVWSNCLAAWVLAGGGAWDRFALVCLGATLLYTGGMFLNDAVDVPFDRQYRPERPIPSGKILARSVWVLSIIWLLAGLAVFFALGKLPVVFASALLVLIVVYDVVHKRTTVAPVLMAGCRFLLYLVAAASVITGHLNSSVLQPAMALAAYVLGLSFLARGESTTRSLKRWPLLLLVLPIGIALIGSADALVLTLLPATAVALWIFWCVFSVRPKALKLVPKSIGGLLAGIALVDWLAAATHGFAAVFLALFVLAMLLQRFAPAT